MSENRSLAASQRHTEAAQKFDYYITGLTAALCAYIAQNWGHQKVAKPFGSEALESAALLILFLAMVAGFRRIEWIIVTLGINYEWLDALEGRAAMASALQESGGRQGVTASGDAFSPLAAMQTYKALSHVAPEIGKKLDHAEKQAARWYKWRNSLLLVGFLILVAARLVALF